MHFVLQTTPDGAGPLPAGVDLTLDEKCMFLFVWHQRSGVDCVSHAKVFADCGGKLNTSPADNVAGAQSVLISICKVNVAESHGAILTEHIGLRFFTKTEAISGLNSCYRSDSQPANQVLSFTCA